MHEDQFMESYSFRKKRGDFHSSSRYLIEPDLASVYDTWKKSGMNPNSNAELLRAIQPWVDQSILAAGGNPNNHALRAKANMMAIAYMRNYDPYKSTIKNFLYGQMQGLQRVVGDEQIIRIPERAALQRQAVEEAEKELYDKLGRYPSDKEIADKIGMSLRILKNIRSMNVPMSESGLNATMESDDNYLASKIPGQNTGDQAWQEYVYDSLPPRSQAVMERMYGMHGRKPEKADAIAKSLKISRAAVSQHKKKIDSLLDSDERYSLLGD